MMASSNRRGRKKNDGTNTDGKSTMSLREMIKESTMVNYLVIL
jgi:hypothetical protein